MDCARRLVILHVCDRGYTTLSRRGAESRDEPNEIGCVGRSVSHRRITAAYVPIVKLVELRPNRSLTASVHARRQSCVAWARGRSKTRAAIAIRIRGTLERDKRLNRNGIVGCELAGVVCL